MRWIGTGPYSVNEVSPGRITLDANPSYWAGPPRSARLVLLEAADPTRALADLDARSLDGMAALVGKFSSPLADRIRRTTSRSSGEDFRWAEPTPPECLPHASAFLQA